MAYITNTVVSGQLDFDQAAWEQMAYFPLRAELFYDSIATVRATNKTTPHANVSFPRMQDLALATSPIGEDTDVSAAVVSKDDAITVTTTEYGNAVVASARVRANSFVDLDPILANLLGYNAGVSIDTVCRTVLEAGDNVVVSNGAGARASIDASDTLKAADIRYAVAKLRGASVQGTAGSLYTGFIHPDVSVDLRAETGVQAFTEPVAYTDANPVRNGEVGTFAGVRWVETPRTPLFVDGGAGAVDAYGTLIVGQEALAKAFSNDPAYGPNPRIILGPVTDKLRRFVPVGWLHLVGYGIFRQEAVWRIESASSIGDNA